MKGSKLTIAALGLVALFGLAACKKVEEVKETTPVLTVNATKIDDVYVGDVVTLPSVSASDETGGDLTGKVNVSVKDPKSVNVTVTNNTFTATEIGNYTVTYTVTNSFAKEATKVFTFAAKDYEKPVITIDSTGVEEYVGTEVTLPTATVTDELDGTITNYTVTVKDPDEIEVTVTENKITLSKIGTYVATYTATNAHEKTATATLNIVCKDGDTPELTTEASTEMGTHYANEVVTLPTVTVSDNSDANATAIVYVVDSNNQETLVSDATYVFTAAGQYKFKYTCTNKFEKTAEALEFVVDIKAEFEIGWDARLYTNAASVLTIDTVNNYKAYLADALKETAFKDVTIKLTPVEDSATADQIVKVTNMEMTLGFTNTLMAKTETSGKLTVKEMKTVKINETTRYVGKIVENDMANAVYAASISENGVASLALKTITIGWFGSSTYNAKVTGEYINAVTANIENWLTEKGYTVDVISKVYYKGSSLPADSVYKDAGIDVVLCADNAAVLSSFHADYCLYGFNFGSNYKSEFLFTPNEVLKGMNLNGATTRYIMKFTKANNDIYVFYDNLWAYISSDGTTEAGDFKTFLSTGWNAKA